MTVSLPPSGKIVCALCHKASNPAFDTVTTEVGGWRITNNPLAWGNANPEVIVLGFSKGPNQIGALRNQPHEQIAYKGGRTNLAKILHHIDLLAAPNPVLVDQAIADSEGRFHFGSLVRCTVERFDLGKQTWTGTGGGMLDRFGASELGGVAVANCSNRFLSQLPVRTKLVVMLGMGAKGNYIRACRRLIESSRPGLWRTVNDVSYTDGLVTVVHTEHFQSQGALIPDWLSENRHERGRLGLLARAGVHHALSNR